MDTHSTSLQNQHGFTLVETLVAIAILLLVIIGPITVAQKGIQNAYFANEQITAVFLAQEAIEAIHTLRDEQALDAFAGVSGVTTGWAPSCPSGNKCAYISSDMSFESCASNNNCILRYDTVTKKYSHDIGGDDSPFTRTVQIDGSDPAHMITVTVTWQSQVFGGDERTVVLRSWIYDRYSGY